VLVGIGRDAIRGDSSPVFTGLWRALGVHPCRLMEIARFSSFHESSQCAPRPTSGYLNMPNPVRLGRYKGWNRIPKEQAKYHKAF